MATFLNLQLAYVWIGLKSALQYRVNFIGGVMGLSLHSLFAALGGIVLIDHFGGVKGWELGQVVFMFGLTRIQTGVIYSVFHAIVGWEYIVQDGFVDRFLVRPRGILTQVPGASFDVNGFGPTLAGAGLVAFGTALEPPNLTWWLVPWLAVVTGSGIVIQLSLMMIAASSAFYNVRLGAATNSLERTAWQMSLFPASAYSAVVQALITVAIPWAFMAFYPAHLLYGRSSDGLFGSPVLYLSPVAAAVAFAIGYSIWRRGIRSYQGMGGM